MTPTLAYRAILLGNIVVIAALLILRPRLWALTRKRNFALVTTSLFAFWSFVDTVAVRSNVWGFPQGAYIQFGMLPLEEYAVFLVHACLCATAVLWVEEQRRDRL
jgi:lycopene cyclase domain-containing protein